ncbi:ABC-type bacteriocin/lantibiotic exporter with N-terminal double-glycine peptidase domain [Burkholderiales bacterium JOSHI_001]|nr:ABC-type bacteriocin/lantibiotic exporter with N-terminal double-glycine peptidase domain [Burkholderiales bacterium JOSHI_001]
MAAIGLGQRLPVLLQMEAAECGLACLAMVAAFHGHRFSLSELRRRFPVSRKGSTLASVLAMADSLQLQGRALRLEPAQLGELHTPCLLHWDMNHFVVLKAVRGQTAVVHDPAVGERRFTLAELGKHFSGVALELEPAADFKPEKEQRPIRLRSLIGPVRGLGGGVAQVLLMALALEVLAVSTPFQLQWTVDHALLAADHDLLLVLGLGFGLLVALRAAVAALRSWLVVKLSTHLNFQWLGQVLGHLLRLPLDWFEKRHLGAILQNFSSVSVIQNTLTHGFVQAVVDGALVLGTLAMMTVYSPTLTALALGAVALYGLLKLAFYPAQRNAAAERLTCQARQQSHLMESARGLQTVRLFGRAAERRMGWQNMLADEFNAGLREKRLGIAQQGANDLLFGALHVLLVWLAARAVLDQRFSLGMLFAFLSYQDQMISRFAALIDKLFELRLLGLHLERVADIVHTAPEPRGEAQGLALAEPAADATPPGIELQGVAYRYAANEPDVLHDVSFRIEPGECVAITGASGGGKTTLVKLMLGLLPPTQGEVRVDGVPLRSLGADRWRAQVGTVMQDDTLFTGSIADNICFFDPQPDAQRIAEVARLAAVHEEIERMPMGYATLVGDIGTGLSGGQKQRILLARALYRRPHVLVLDEATSHLDIFNEQAVNQAIQGLRLTRIVIAHRPETIRMAQRVLHLQGGRLVAAAPAAMPRGLAPVAVALGA